MLTVTREENESFYDNFISESIRNNQDIPICRIENTSESTPFISSENNVNTSENMKNVLPVSIDNSRTKYDQVARKCLKEKILNEVKQQFSPSNHGDKMNAELVKSMREQIENLQSEICFLREEMKAKKILY